MSGYEGIITKYSGSIKVVTVDPNTHCASAYGHQHLEVNQNVLPQATPPHEQFLQVLADDMQDTYMSFSTHGYVALGNRRRQNRVHFAALHLNVRGQEHDALDPTDVYSNDEPSTNLATAAINCHRTQIIINSQNVSMCTRF